MKTSYIHNYLLVPCVFWITVVFSSLVSSIGVSYSYYPNLYLLTICYFVINGDNLLLPLNIVIFSLLSDVILDNYLGISNIAYMLSYVMCRYLKRFMYFQLFIPRYLLIVVVITIFYIVNFLSNMIVHVSLDIVAELSKMVSTILFYPIICLLSLLYTYIIRRKKVYNGVYN